MATRRLTKPAAPQDCWSWTVELDGTADECRFRVSRDGALLLSGSITADDGALTVQLHQGYIGEGPNDWRQLNDAVQFALAESRALMLGLDGQVGWAPHPDPHGGMGEPA